MLFSEAYEIYKKARKFMKIKSRIKLKICLITGKLTMSLKNYLKYSSDVLF